MRAGNFHGALKTRVTYYPLVTLSIGRMFSVRIIRGFIASSSLRDIGCTRRTVGQFFKFKHCRKFCDTYERASTIRAPIFINRDDYRDLYDYDIVLLFTYLCSQVYTIERLTTWAAYTE